MPETRYTTVVNNPKTFLNNRVDGIELVSLYVDTANGRAYYDEHIIANPNKISFANKKSPRFRGPTATAFKKAQKKNDGIIILGDWWYEKNAILLLIKPQHFDFVIEKMFSVAEELEKLQSKTKVIFERFEVIT